jgi:hypothetical protein
MQAAIDRVMQTFTMLARLTPGCRSPGNDDGALEGMDADEKTLAAEGLRYLRGAVRGSKRRTKSKI